MLSLFAESMARSPKCHPANPSQLGRLSASFLTDRERKREREKDEERDTWCAERRMTDQLSLNYSGTERQKGGGGKARSGGGGESAELQGVFNCQ